MTDPQSKLKGAELKPRATTNVAAQLKHLQEDITLAWERQAQMLLAAARKQDERTLRDSIPRLITNLADVLMTPANRGNVYEKARIGTSYGQQRALTGDYTLDDLVIEFRLLRATIFEALAPSPALKPRLRRTIHDFCDAYIAEATTEFISWRKDVADAGAGEASVAQRTLSVDELGHFLRLGFDNMDVGITFTELSGRFMDANPAFCRLVGYSRAELSKTAFSNITHPDDRARSLELAAQMAAGEILGFDMEKRFLHKLGHIVWVRLHLMLLRSEGDPPALVIGIHLPRETP